MHRKTAKVQKHLYRAAAVIFAVLAVYGNVLCAFAKVSSNQPGYPPDSDISAINLENVEKRMADGTGQDEGSRLGKILFAGGSVLSLLAAGTGIIVWKRKKLCLCSGSSAWKEKAGIMDKKRTDISMTGKLAVSGKMAVSGSNAVGKIHNIGKRKSQQDSLGVAEYENGICAIIADGMGGLADGEKVSQKIVLTMMQDAGRLKAGNTQGMLYRMVSHVNREVNRMLGVSDKYSSGSTLIAVLLEAGSFQWISVGDSRIYLYRGGRLIQMNREHVYEADLLRKAVNDEISFEEAAKEPQKKNLSSFIGMGELRYIDGSMRPVDVVSGDKLLLMSDGVFNTVSDEEICQVLSAGNGAEETARVLEERVLFHQNPRQDNFTAILINIL